MADIGQNQNAALGLYRVTGEDAPAWLAGGFSVIGLVLALATSFLVASPPPVPSGNAPASENSPSPLLNAPITPPESAQPFSTTTPPLQPDVPAAGSAEATKRDVGVDCPPIVSVAFPSRSSHPIKQGAQERLAALLKWIARNPSAKLLVEGHTDSKGREAYNVMLSYARAQAVIAWLETEGVEKERMTPLAAGSAQPQEPLSIVAENRMALVRVEGVAPCQTEGNNTQ